ncbi:ribonuclease T1 [Deinococcus metalli]|uniref:Ribonuclease T1 n=1 Tax=Deinococcus metalli TaxID=1141878 RepID=A0A7W8KB49_9DEIO|nr:ribonuclease domain-containing protein [Deinococcus metalli]MBB5374994.1 ribonuclease T1 [Deinococcus metalli]
MRRSIPLLALLITLLGACAGPSRPQGSGATTGATSAPGTASSTRAPQPARDPDSGLRWIARSDLPREAGPVLTRIAQGGPFRSARDGVTFANREGILPRAARGTYREYTVPTPGASDRGARRIVCAGAPRSTAECYYTADHYASFRRIQP